MTSRPIVASVAPRSETGREIEAAGAGVLSPAEDPSSLAAAIDWMREHPEEAAVFGAAGRAYAEANLTPASVLKGYDAFIEKIAAARDTQERRMRSLPERTRPTPMPSGAGEARRPTESTAGVDVALSCLIVSYRSAAILEQCVAALGRERASLPLEVIVVDNASRDGTVELIERKFPWVKVISNDENSGFAQATNIAMRHARAPLLLHLNPDAIVPAGGLAAAIAELERRPDIGMLGGKLVRSTGEFDHACKRGAPTIASSLYYFFGLARLFPTSSRFAHYTAGDLDKDEAGYVDAVTGAFMLVRREAVDEVGEFDERYWLYGEDLDWCARFWEHGWRILYWPGIEVVHLKGGTTGGYRSWKLNVAFYKSMGLYYDKHLSQRHSRFMTGLVRVGIWANFAGAVVKSAVGSGLQSAHPTTRRDDATTNTRG
jgi:GT2 family glycosyltransferase